MQKDVIKRMVRDVLQEKGLLSRPKEDSASNHTRRDRTEPVVLTVFHPGVRKLDQALEQVKQIQAVAAKSSTYTVNSARSWLCGEDVREKAGSRCILDTVKPEGIEKVLHKADILVLPTFCFKTAAKVARLIGDDQESAIVLSALIQDKPILAANDGFTLLDILSNKRIQQEIKQILSNLESYGMVLCKTEQLAATFQKIIDSGNPSGSTTAKKTSPKKPASQQVLITAKDIRMAADNNQGTILLPHNGIITPLARDHAKEYEIKIVKQHSE